MPIPSTFFRRARPLPTSCDPFLFSLALPASRVLTLAAACTRSRNSITPVRGHCALITPPVNYAGPNAFRRTYGSASCYQVTTPAAGNVIGIGWVLAEKFGIGQKKEFVGVTDDSVVLPKMKECASARGCSTAPHEKANGG
jgi:hypothetical protein